jgi:hypothetical protein
MPRSFFALESGFGAAMRGVRANRAAKTVSAQSPAIAAAYFEPDERCRVAGRRYAGNATPEILAHSAIRRF